jgi:two-component sensor histidine kinase
MAAQTPMPQNGADSLALAVVLSSATPLLLLDSELGVIAASTSFCRGFGLDPIVSAGRRLGELGAGEWNAPQLAALLRATVAGNADIEAYEMDLRRPDKDTLHLVLNARKLDYGVDNSVRLLLSIADVTAARAAEKVGRELLLDKSMLLQELQHRIANSLQIIASVLMQSARRVQSDESRSHLQAAHQRVMSVAALQRQLAVSAVDTVALRPYFVELCHTLAASMIHDPELLSLKVDADDTTTSADVSVSLGLIVTELVINALKHGYPGDRGGTILVSYHTSPSGWRMSVADDGVGRPIGEERSKTGLGTSIVEALARQVGARVEIVDGNPGTIVSVLESKA